MERGKHDLRHFWGRLSLTQGNRRRIALLTKGPQAATPVHASRDDSHFSIVRGARRILSLSSYHVVFPVLARSPRGHEECPLGVPCALPPRMITRPRPGSIRGCTTKRPEYRRGLALSSFLARHISGEKNTGAYSQTMASQQLPFPKSPPRRVSNRTS